MLPEVPARRAFSIVALEMTENENVYVARVQHDNTLVSARRSYPAMLPSDHPRPADLYMQI
jgi:hypothetical protein